MTVPLQFSDSLVKGFHNLPLKFERNGTNFASANGLKRVGFYGAVINQEVQNFLGDFFDLETNIAVCIFKPAFLQHGLEQDSFVERVNVWISLVRFMTAFDFKSAAD